MAHIELGNDEPGIRGLMRYRPLTAGPLSDLAETLLRADNSLTRGERELIAATVSRGNECTFCGNFHATIAAVELGVEDLTEAPRTPKLTALLAIADKVRVSGQKVLAEDVAAAREAGATDEEIHDTVLIAAAFCIYNRYVDGLGTWASPTQADYLPSAQHVSVVGYQNVG
ncbi:carboxymuconolactone decarboxylase family protein [Actinokineospora diospyrosa]|uniref:Peroxidase-related enzyme n=1 Tax=Actinokineospora diospyrosa TaxID=103728 RepID=A0ABT1IEA2_9PSEU|nr:carboxymuconolactone decarboxylase family protein [Actinokineospora diospyrosa]MCP2270960.1 putative peroxidase-related enzyme [Actinokineospora diospyrosa]